VAVFDAQVWLFWMRVNNEIRVDSRHTIQRIFRVPLAGDAMAGDAVRAPSRSVGAEGLEPPTC
jgi:hypothetical protein